jgi:hypothetical protein
LPDLRAAETGFNHGSKPVITECVLALQSQPNKRHFVLI